MSMRAIITGHSYDNEIQTISQVFSPNERFIKTEIPEPEGLTIASTIEGDFFRGVIYENGKKLLEKELSSDAQDEKERKHLAKLAMYLALSQYTGIRPSWGLLTGIRPAKIIHQLWREGLSDDEAVAHMEDKYLVMRSKARLCLEVARRERKIIEGTGRNQLGLYIGIPFCPTRCLYCSFTSYPLNKYVAMTDDYVKALVKELEFLSKKAEPFELESIYMGGGTPTSLSEAQLALLMDNIRRLFSFDKLKEYTVEAGRPDTISLEKLETLKRSGVTRLSVNPQTLKDKTLRLIGREHTAEQFFQAFALAREAGFQDINVDIILGLPEESLEDVQATLDGILELEPEGVTAHTLSVKRASRLKEELSSYQLTQARAVEEMLRLTSDTMSKSGMFPYYMYRQKNMLGNFENVGYCKPGFEGIYNIQIMEEKQSIWAAGAGAVTKLVEPSTGLISRVFNVKAPEGYINRIDEMINRKGRSL